ENQVEAAASSSSPSSITVDEPYANQQLISSLSAANEDLANGLKVNEDAPGIVSRTEKTVLKRNLSLFSGISFIIGIIIGTGIFVSPKGVLLYSESIGLCLIIWVASGLIVLVGALCYAEIGTVIPLSGTELSYIQEGTTKKPLGIALAFYSGLWAYDGWNCLNATWGNVVLGPVVRVLLILISISALGTCNGSLFMSGRYCMVGARYGYLPEVFACIQKQRLTPLPAIVLEVEATYNSC
ncbi:unnamed protein product, partial [Rotaria sp. Silwood1]